MTTVSNHKLIDSIKEQLEHVSDEPTKLPSDYRWESLDFTDDKTFQLTLSFVNKHYYEAEGFRHHYTEDLFRWITCRKPYDSYFNLGVMWKDQIVGYIHGRLSDFSIENKKSKVLEVILACVIPPYRKKQLFNIMVKEMTRRAHLRDVKYGLFTTPYQVSDSYTAKIVYCHRILDLNECIKTGFTDEIEDSDRKRMLQKLYYPKEDDIKVPDNYKIIELEEKDIDRALGFLNRNLSQKLIHHIYTREEFISTFISPEVKTYLLLKNNQMASFSSFYIQPYLKLNDDSIVKSVIPLYHIGEQIPFLFKYTFYQAKELGAIVANIIATFIETRDQNEITNIKLSDGNGVLYMNIINYPEEIKSYNNIGTILF
jgi:hypothetical protein